MKNLKAFINKNTIKNIRICTNRFGITEKDLIGGLKGFPIGVVVRMLEEQEKQGNKPDVKVFQKDISNGSTTGGFYWDDTEDRSVFWSHVLSLKEFDKFYKNHPDYKKYDKQ